MTVLRHRLGWLTVLSLWMGVAAEVAAQQKPAIVVSLASVKEQMADIRYVTQVAGNPQIAGLIEFMTAQYTQVLDADKPGGAAIWLSDDGTPTVLGFLPVKNLDALSALLAQQVGPLQDAGNGVKQLPLPQPVFIKQVGTYAYVSDKMESLANVPQDPATYLQGLDSKYNLAVAVNVQSIPTALKNWLIDQYEQLLQSAAENRDAEPELQQLLNFSSMSIDQYRKLAAEGDQFIYGLNVDAQGQAVYLDMKITALPQTGFARELVGVLADKSDFRGFYQPGAIAAGVFASRIPMEQYQQLKESIDALKAFLEQEIEKASDLDDQYRGHVRDLLDKTIDILTKTCQSGVMDIGFVVTGNEENLQIVAGARVADGAQVEGIVDTLAALAETEEDVKVEKNVERFEGFTFHRISGPAPDEQYANVFGDVLELGVAVANNAALVTFGKGSIEVAKKTIRDSKQPGMEPANQLYIAVTPILSFLEKMGALDDAGPALEAARGALEKASGKDRIVFSASEIPNGQQIRIAVQEGLIAAIGAAVSSFTGQQ